MNMIITILLSTKYVKPVGTIMVRSADGHMTAYPTGRVLDTDAMNETIITIMAVMTTTVLLMIIAPAAITVIKPLAIAFNDAMQSMLDGLGGYLSTFTFQQLMNDIQIGIQSIGQFIVNR